MTSTSPIPLATFEASVGDPLAARFFPAGGIHVRGVLPLRARSDLVPRVDLRGAPRGDPVTGDYFSLASPASRCWSSAPHADEIVAMSAVCRHRGMIVAEGQRPVRIGVRVSVPPLDLRPPRRLVGAPQMGSQQPSTRRGARSRDSQSRRGAGLSSSTWTRTRRRSLRGSAARADRRARTASRSCAANSCATRPTTSISTRLELEGVFRSAGRVLSTATSCTATRRMRSIDCGTIEMGAQDAITASSATVQARATDVTLNHLGRSVFPAIELARRRRASPDACGDDRAGAVHAVAARQRDRRELVASGPSSIRVKRHRLYPQSTLDRDDFVELHALETAADRDFVAQDEFALDRVQVGLQSRYAPRGAHFPEGAADLQLQPLARRALSGRRRGGAQRILIRVTLRRGRSPGWERPECRHQQDRQHVAPDADPQHVDTRAHALVV